MEVANLPGLHVKTNEKGEYYPAVALFRNWIKKDGSSGFPAEAGRYHLYASYACPFACRCLAAINLKGLEHVISVTIAKPVYVRTREDDDHVGWEFADIEGEEPGCSPDYVNCKKYLRDVYELVVSPTYKGRFSVPLLWDKVNGAIVSNESPEILKMLNSEFNEVAKHPEVDIYPERLRSRIEEINRWLKTDINSGVYRCGFATKQTAYEEALPIVFRALDRCEAILEKQRYIAGSVLTTADIHLFMSLIRFDEVYYMYFKCNRKLIQQYPNLSNYTKDLFQMPGIGSTVNMEYIKKHYYHSHPLLNPLRIVPVGPSVDFSTAHDRVEKFNKAVATTS